jgi:hypothetical protein
MDIIEWMVEPLLEYWNEIHPITKRKKKKKAKYARDKLRL